MCGHLEEEGNLAEFVPPGYSLPFTFMRYGHGINTLLHCKFGCLGFTPLPVAGPGFPIGGRAPIRRGHGPPTWAFFGENVCENERIGSHRGWRAPGTPPRSANASKQCNE